MSGGVGGVASGRRRQPEDSPRRQRQQELEAASRRHGRRRAGEPPAAAPAPNRTSTPTSTRTSRRATAPAADAWSEPAGGTSPLLTLDRATEAFPAFGVPGAAPFTPTTPVPARPPTGGFSPFAAASDSSYDTGYDARYPTPITAPTTQLRPVARGYREPKPRRTGLGGASRWELLGLIAFVSAAATLIVVLTSRGLLSDDRDGAFLPGAAAQVTAAASPSGAAAVAGARPAGGGTWWSGAASAVAADGTWSRWRGEPITVGGAWDNGNQQMVEMRSICPGGSWATWNKPLDLAVGAIEVNRGESWAQAARGAYDQRWVTNLQRIKSCWGKRDPSLLYIRFAHEMNLTDMPWRVKGGEEADFVRALTRYSTLRYLIIPKAKLVLCPSDGTSGGLGVDLFKLWPGKDSQGRQVVQAYGVDTYNSWVVARTPEEFQNKLFADQNGMPLGLEKHRLMAHDWGVPFVVPEWAGNGKPTDEGQGADLPIYYRMMNEWFRANAADPKHPKPGQLLYEIYFNDQDRFMLLPTKYQPQSAAQYRSLVWGH